MVACRPELYNFVLNFFKRVYNREWYGHENRKTQNTLKSGTATHMSGRTTVKSGTALAILAVLVAPHLADIKYHKYRDFPPDSPIVNYLMNHFSLINQKL